MLYNNVCLTSLVIYLYSIRIKRIPATYLRHIRNNIIYFIIISYKENSNVFNWYLTAHLHLLFSIWCSLNICCGVTLAMRLWAFLALCVQFRYCQSEITHSIEVRREREVIILAGSLDCDHWLWLTAIERVLWKLLALLQEVVGILQSRSCSDILAFIHQSNTRCRDAICIIH